MKVGRTNTVALALCLLAGGCAPTVWYRPNTTQAELGIDNARCTLVAEGANPDSGVETISTGSFKRDLAVNAAAGVLHGVAQGLAVGHTYGLCMQANGYVANAPGAPAAAPGVLVPPGPAVYPGPAISSPAPIAAASLAPNVAPVPAPNVEGAIAETVLFPVTITNRYHSSWSVPVQ